jgi:hypothetical protein
MAAGSLLTVPMLTCVVLCPYSCCANAGSDDQRYNVAPVEYCAAFGVCIMHLLALHCKGAEDAACHSSAGPHINAR